MRDRDKFEVTPAQWAHVGKILGFKRKRPKKTPVFDIATTQEKGYHLRPASGFSRKHVPNYHAYECIAPDCMFEFRLRPARDPKVVKCGIQVTCPECEGLYIEWLSYGMDPSDAFLGNEEEMARAPQGSARLTRLSTRSGRPLP